MQSPTRFCVGHARAPGSENGGKRLIGRETIRIQHVSETIKRRVGNVYLVTRRALDPFRVGVSNDCDNNPPAVYVRLGQCFSTGGPRDRYGRSATSKIICFYFRLLSLLISENKVLGWSATHQKYSGWSAVSGTLDNNTGLGTRQLKTGHRSNGDQRKTLLLI